MSRCVLCSGRSARSLKSLAERLSVLDDAAVEWVVMKSILYFEIVGHVINNAESGGTCPSRQTGYIHGRQVESKMKVINPTAASQGASHWQWQSQVNHNSRMWLHQLPRYIATLETHYRTSLHSKERSDRCMLLIYVAIDKGGFFSSPSQIPSSLDGLVGTALGTSHTE